MGGGGRPKIKYLNGGGGESNIDTTVNNEKRQTMNLINYINSGDKTIYDDYSDYLEVNGADKILSLMFEIISPNIISSNLGIMIKQHKLGSKLSSAGGILSGINLGSVLAGQGVGAISESETGGQLIETMFDPETQSQIQEIASNGDLDLYNTTFDALSNAGSAVWEQLGTIEPTTIISAGIMAYFGTKVYGKYLEKKNKKGDRLPFLKRNNIKKLISKLNKISIIDNLEQENRFIDNLKIIFEKNDTSNLKIDNKSYSINKFKSNISKIYCNRALKKYIIDNFNKTHSKSDISLDDIICKKIDNDIVPDNDLEIFKYTQKRNEYENTEEFLLDLIDMFQDGSGQLTQIINKLPQEYTKHIKRIIKTYPSIQLFRLKKPGQNIDDIRLLDSSIYVHENGFASNQPGPFVLLTQKDKDQNIRILSTRLYEYLKNIQYESILNNIDDLISNFRIIDVKKDKKEDDIIKNIQNQVFNSEDALNISSEINKIYFSTSNLFSKNTNPNIISQYHEYIKDVIRSSFDSKNNYTNFIFVDHILQKHNIMFYIDKYKNLLDEIKLSVEKLNKIIKDKKGLSKTDRLLLRKLFGKLENKTKIVIQTLKRNNLTHKINAIKRLASNSLTVGYFVKLHNEERFRLSIIKKLGLFEIEKINFERSIKEIYEYYTQKKDKLKKDKKTKKKFSDLFKLKLSEENKKERETVVNELKEKINKVLPESVEKADQLDQIDKLKDLQDKHNQELRDIIEKYEMENSVNLEKLDELQRMNEITNQNADEIKRELSKQKTIKNEVSIKARELLLDKYRQLQNKKKIEDAAIEELILVTEKIKIEIAKVRDDFDKKSKELFEIKQLKKDLLKDQKELDMKKLKMEMAKSTLDKKSKQILRREQKIKDTIKTISKESNIRSDRSRNLKRRPRV